MTCSERDHEKYRGVFGAKNGCLACQLQAERELSKKSAELIRKWMRRPHSTAALTEIADALERGA